MRPFHLCATLLAFTLVPLSVGARPGHDRPLPELCSAGATPDGYVKAITMLSDGSVADAADAQLDPIPFWMDTFGWDEDDIEENRRDALDFFDARFGLDGEGLMAGGRALFYPFLTNETMRYRATNISGEAVNHVGWKNIDTAWMLMITDPAGVVLPSGQFQGVHMPPGSFVVFGQYYLVPTGVPAACGRSYHPKPIRISYSSGCPIIPDMAGVITFICDLHHPVWGVGKAAGTSVSALTPDGRLSTNTRNYLTFPPEAPLAEPDDGGHGHGNGHGHGHGRR